MSCFHVAGKEVLIDDDGAYDPSTPREFNSPSRVSFQIWTQVIELDSVVHNYCLGLDFGAQYQYPFMHNYIFTFQFIICKQCVFAKNLKTSHGKYSLCEGNPSRHGRYFWLCHTYSLHFSGFPGAKSKYLVALIYHNIKERPILMQVERTHTWINED